MNDVLEIVVNNVEDAVKIEIDQSKFYTTTQVAKICQLARGIIADLFDKGYLKGFKIPGSKYRNRRILGNSLIKFMKENGMYEYLGERIYTTGEAAKLCRVSTPTIIKCFDNKMLKGYLIPGTNTNTDHKFRHIPEKCLIQFMKEYGMYEYLKDNLGVV